MSSILRDLNISLVGGFIAALLAVLLQPAVAIIFHPLDMYPPTIARVAPATDRPEMTFEVYDVGSGFGGFEFYLYDRYGTMVEVDKTSDATCERDRFRFLILRECTPPIINIKLKEPRNNRTFYYDLYVQDRNNNRIHVPGTWR